MTSRVRRLRVVEPSPVRHEPQASPTEEPSPTTADSAVPQLDSAEQEGLDAAATGMALLLHLALRLMKSPEAGTRTRR
jgi:hypothetical protein